MLHTMPNGADGTHFSAVFACCSVSVSWSLCVLESLLLLLCSSIEGRAQP